MDSKDTKVRCDWSTSDPIYIEYHDTEWGVPIGRPTSSALTSDSSSQSSRSGFSSLNVSKDMSRSDKSKSESTEDTVSEEQIELARRRDDQKMFEFLTLESAQAGLTWITILKRREGYRRVFHNFDVDKVAAMTEQDIQKALQDTGIIRNKLKVRAAVNNAKVYKEIQKEFGTFCEYIWGFVGGSTIDNARNTMDEVQVTTDESDALSKDLKKRGMSFVGSTIIYAHMQASGMVNDHVTTCFRYEEVKGL